MFISEKCRKTTQDNQPVNTVVVEKRNKRYINTVKKNKRTFTIESEGWEIVKEIKTCPDCYQQFTGIEGRKRIEKQPPPRKQRNSFHRRRRN